MEKHRFTDFDAYLCVSSINGKHYQTDPGGLTRTPRVKVSNNYFDILKFFVDHRNLKW